MLLHSAPDHLQLEKHGYLLYSRILEGIICSLFWDAMAIRPKQQYWLTIEPGVCKSEYENIRLCNPDKWGIDNSRPEHSALGRCAPWRRCASPDTGKAAELRGWKPMEIQSKRCSHPGTAAPGEFPAFLHSHIPHFPVGTVKFYLLHWPLLQWRRNGQKGLREF